MPDLFAVHLATMHKALSGHCLCGNVRVTVADSDNTVGACHCGMCRRWGGGPYMHIACGTVVTFQGEESITVFQSSARGARAFCSNCGSHLFYRFTHSGELMIAAGLFDDDGERTFDRELFVGDKPRYYRFADNTRRFIGDSD